MENATFVNHFEREVRNLVEQSGYQWSVMYGAWFSIDQDVKNNMPTLLAHIPSKRRDGMGYDFQIRLHEVIDWLPRYKLCHWVYDVIIRNKDIVAFILKEPNKWHLSPWIEDSEWVAINLPCGMDEFEDTGIVSLSTTVRRTCDWVNTIESKWFLRLFLRERNPSSTQEPTSSH